MDTRWPRAHNDAMFEIYTEKARRVIFFARYEAAQAGATHIETEHLLLGLVREDRALTLRAFPASSSVVSAVRDAVRKRTPPRNPAPTSTDLPLSGAGRRVLTYAAEESKTLKHTFIGTEHILLGLLREKAGLAAEILAPFGIDGEAIRASIREPSQSNAETFASKESRYHANTSTYFGKYRGVVINNLDPEQTGRLLIQVPSVGTVQLGWATPCVPYPAGTPVLAVPPNGTSVWVEFEGGSVEHPVWSGCFWNAGQPPMLKLA